MSTQGCVIVENPVKDMLGHRPLRTKFDFSDQVTLVTGAAGGIGRRIAQLVHESGGDLVLVDLNVEATRAVADSLLGGSGETIVVAADSRDGESLDALADRVKIEFGRVDHIVLAAGIFPSNLVKDIEDDEWHTVLNINLQGVFMTIKRLIPLIAEGGSIVNIASAAAHRGSYGHAHYAASKAGVVSLTRTLALELGPTVRVNAVSPGVTVTSMIDDYLAQHGDRLIDQSPLGRHGHPEEIASVVAFLMSDAASFVNGEILHANGGALMTG